jgi:CDC-like kinase
LQEFLGEGTYGQVIRAKDKKTGELVAIKLIKNIFRCTYAARLLLREIFILRKLTEMEENIFTVKLLDIILPS